VGKKLLLWGIAIAFDTVLSIAVAVGLETLYLRGRTTIRTPGLAVDAWMYPQGWVPDFGLVLCVDVAVCFLIFGVALFLVFRPKLLKSRL
jgi:hypothetical protein